MKEVFAVFAYGSEVEIIAQILGLIAFAVSVLSFQMRAYRGILIVQAICAMMFTVHLGMMFIAGHSDALAGCVGNGIFFIRDLIFIFVGEREEKCPWLKTVVFSTLMIVSGIITWRSPVSIFCMCGMVLNTISFSMKNPQTIRKMILVASPFFFAYELLNNSIGGTINEIVSFISAVIGLVRYRKKY